jgi:collagenase-like PrtC family protease
MSAQSYNLLHEVPALRALGIDSLRISPQQDHLGEIIAAFDAARRGEPVDVDGSLWNASGQVDGYWFGDAGIRQRHTEALAHLGAHA